MCILHEANNLPVPFSRFLRRIPVWNDNFANVNIEHYNSDPVISLFGNMQIMFQYMEYDVTCIKWTFASHISATKIIFTNDHSCSALLYTTNCNPKRHRSVQISKSFGLQPVTRRPDICQRTPLLRFGWRGCLDALIFVRGFPCCVLVEGDAREARVKFCWWARGWIDAMIFAREDSFLRLVGGERWLVFVKGGPIRNLVWVRMTSSWTPWYLQKRRQIIRYRATATLRRPQIKKYTAGK